MDCFKRLRQVKIPRMIENLNIMRLLTKSEDNIQKSKETKNTRDTHTQLHSMNEK